MKLRDKCAGVLLRLGSQDALDAYKAVVHTALGIGEPKMRVHTDELRGGDLPKADSPAEQSNAKLRLQSLRGNCDLEIG